MGIKKIKKTTVVEQVMEQIKDLISSGAYKPGDKIPTELELAESFGVGRSSIREAIKIFNYMGVLSSQAAKGTFVEERSNISSESLTWSLLLGEDELNEMIDLRGSIEIWAMFKLVDEIASKSSIGNSVVKELKTIVENMRNFAVNNERNNLIEADFQFHNTIIQGCNNTLFTSLIKTLKSFLYNEIEQSQLVYTDLTQIPKEHELLLSALLSGKKSSVYSAYSDHISNIKERMRGK
ncbi:MAG: GntR family transcriptional regulator [Spirochaetes bacterium]|nr:MAG: GntR family transcriptional regulator [Spirochaetota bacterium]